MILWNCFCSSASPLIAAFSLARRSLTSGGEISLPKRPLAAPVRRFWDYAKVFRKRSIRRKYWPQVAGW